MICFLPLRHVSEGLCFCLLWLVSDKNLLNNPLMFYEKVINKLLVIHLKYCAINN